MVRTIVMESGDVSATITADAVSTERTQDPAAMPYVPPDSHFGEEQDYRESEQLEALAWEVINRHPEFHWLRDFQGGAEIHVVWKRKGGKSKGKATFGTCTKPSGMLKFYAKADYIIWIAADHLRESGWTNFQLEALVYHELKHCEPVIDDDPKSPTAGEIIGYGLKTHDSEVFFSELVRYGAWNQSRADLRDTWAQVALNAGPTPD
jgi:hypothetical protein